MTSGASVWRVAVAAFVLGTLVCLALLQLCPLLYDADSYYHLAIARIYAERGLVRELPELRLSLLGSHFGDKELLFHLLLLPFAAHGEAGGRAALALCVALVCAALAGAAARAVGWWALLVPAGLAVGSLDTTWRLVRLRPELLSLALLVALLALLASARPRAAGVVTFVYTLSYTAFHVALGLAGMVAIAAGWPRRRAAWALVLYPALGAALGLVVHPQFPANLRIWAVQNASYFSAMGGLDVGSELDPHTVRDAVLLNLGWLAGVAVLWRARRRETTAVPEALAMARAFGIAAVVFLLLYVRMARFGVYFFSFATLCLVWLGAARGGFARVRLWRGRTVPLAAGLAAALLLAVPEFVAQTQLFLNRTTAGPGDRRLREREAFARAVPAGARVAATWRSTALYLFVAPQGRYLNALDPVFMASPYPLAYAVQRDVFAGDEPDVPLAVAGPLASEYVALSLATAPVELQHRLDADPRVETVYRDWQALYRIRQGANASFALDWRRVPAAVAPEAVTAAALGTWPAYPRAAGLGAAFEGFVDARRGVSGAACARFARELDLERPVERRWEFAPFGTGALWVDGARVATVVAPQRAVLGAGAVLTPRLAAGAHLLVVEVCAPPQSPRQGFYLRFLD